MNAVQTGLNPTLEVTASITRWCLRLTNFAIEGIVVWKCFSVLDTITSAEGRAVRALGDRRAPHALSVRDKTYPDSY